MRSREIPAIMPRSAAKPPRLDHIAAAQIIATYDMLGNYAQTARSHGVSRDTVKRIVSRRAQYGVTSDMADTLIGQAYQDHADRHARAAVRHIDKLDSLIDTSLDRAISGIDDINPAQAALIASYAITGRNNLSRILAASPAPQPDDLGGVSEREADDILIRAQEALARRRREMEAKAIPATCEVVAEEPEPDA